MRNEILLITALVRENVTTEMNLILSSMAYGEVKVASNRPISLSECRTLLYSRKGKSCCKSFRGLKELNFYSSLLIESSSRRD